MMLFGFCFLFQFSFKLTAPSDSEYMYEMYNVLNQNDSWLHLDC